MVVPWFTKEGLTKMLNVEALEAAANSGEQQLFTALHGLSLDEIGHLYLSRPSSPALSRLLPSLAPDQVQRDWTGSDGVQLMETSKAFIKSVDAASLHYTGSGLDGKTILDYGCGYGRLILMLYKYTMPDRIFGCDPWDESLRHCAESGIKANLSLCEYVPTKPVFPPAVFDVGYSFSVFTHLSPRTCKAVLDSVLPSIKPGGMFTITIRPPEFWEFVQRFKALQGVTGKEMLGEHLENGIAYYPEPGREPVNGDVTFGDTSISLGYIRDNWKEWRILGTTHNEVDPMQLLVHLTPA
jgi:SAM-dependent methyltransferase